MTTGPTAAAWLSTSQCADLLGVSAGFVRGEIRDGRLRASKLIRPGKRTVYRVAAVEFATYLGKHWDHSTVCRTSAQSA